MKIGESINLGPYEWMVLGVESNKALVITKDIIGEEDCGYSTNKWADTGRRRWLNDEFFSRFTAEE
jgi:hypothetical protein